MSHEVHVTQPAIHAPKVRSTQQICCNLLSNLHFQSFWWCSHDEDLPALALPNNADGQEPVSPWL